jgi:hypothetical protein
MAIRRGRGIFVGRSPGLVHLIIITWLAATVSAVENVAPAFSARLRAERPGSDGAVLVLALGAHREVRGHERRLGRRLTLAEIGMPSHVCSACRTATEPAAEGRPGTSCEGLVLCRRCTDGLTQRHADAWQLAAP